jgi:hypothetical protein
MIRVTTNILESCQIAECPGANVIVSSGTTVRLAK